MENNVASLDEEINLAKGSLVVSDRTLFIEIVKYFNDKGLVQEFNDYLEQQNCYEIIVDVAFVNHMKQFLLRTRNVNDDIARLALLCMADGTGGGGPGGGSPTGVRG